MSGTKTVRVNGEDREYAAGAFPASVGDLVCSLGLDVKMVVAEVNGDIVGRSNLAAHPLRPGDVVELVRFVGGG
ncbi:MAG: sulfur carrier protein ThiS [Planctomycetota bacterium]|jgi:thiamine biosynthesis protein ThiS|nr:sulfur carrier protein ThiS [Planctomycetota bacterium]